MVSPDNLNFGYLRVFSMDYFPPKNVMRKLESEDHEFQHRLFLLACREQLLNFPFLYLQ